MEARKMLAFHAACRHVYYATAALNDWQERAAQWRDLSDASAAGIVFG